MYSDRVPGLVPLQSTHQWKKHEQADRRTRGHHLCPDCASPEAGQAQHEPTRGRDEQEREGRTWRPGRKGRGQLLRTGACQSKPGRRRAQVQAVKRQISPPAPAAARGEKRRKARAIRAKRGIFRPPTPRFSEVVPYWVRRHPNDRSLASVSGAHRFGWSIGDSNTELKDTVKAYDNAIPNIITSKAPLAAGD